MARYDAAGTGGNPAASGPKDGVQVRWETAPETAVSGPAPPVLIGETLFAVGREGLVALERDTGRLRFERLGHSYLSAPARVSTTTYRSDTLAVTGIDGVHGLSADGGYAAAGYSVGLERWYAPGREPPMKRYASPAGPPPVATEGSVYAVLPGSDRIIALDGNSGRVRWEQDVETSVATLASRPAVRNGTVFVCGWESVLAFDAETGQHRWTGMPGTDGTGRHRDLLAPTATDEGIVVPSRSDVALLDPADGSLEWEYRHDGNATDGSAAVADGTVFVSDGDDALHAIDLETGTKEWTAEYRHEVHPVVADGVVYLTYAWHPELVALDAETGERRFTYEGLEWPSQPVVGDGVLYVVGHERVVALEEGE
nr:PQQ-binding-like beta-propeller repeat protein [Halopiger goleimassiliensis]